MKVLVIPEDFRKDQYVLRPILKRLFRSLGKRTVRVQICVDPPLMGVDQAMNATRLQEIIEQYRMHDLIILCVDRDCNVNRRLRLDQLEKRFGAKFLAVDAWEELETWVLAGLALPSEWNWSDVRRECDVKEHNFEPLADQMGVSDGLGGGREILGEQASRRINAIRQKCPEDFDALAQRLENLT